MGNGGVSLSAGIASGRNQANDPDPVATGTNGLVYQFPYGAGGWSALAAASVSLSSGIAMAPNYLNNQNLFAIGSDGNLWQDWWTGSAMSGWSSMGNGGVPFVSGVAAL